MIFNVRLRQAYVYDAAIETDSPKDAVEIAKKRCHRDRANWAAEGPVRKVSVDPDPDRALPDYYAEDMDDSFFDMFDDFDFGDDPDLKPIFAE